MRREAGRENTIFINCGNLTKSSIKNDFVLKDRVLETALKGYDLMGADIFTPGAQELIYGRKMMLTLKGYAGNSTIICGNLDGKPLPGFKTHKISTISGKKILITSIIDKKLERKAIHGLKLKDPLTSLNQILKVPHDLAIVVFHFSDKRAISLLSQVQGIDIAILGTQRGTMLKDKVLNGCLLVKNNNHGKTMGYLDWDFATNTPTANKLLQINKDTYPADKKMAAMVEKYEGWLRKHYIELEKNKAAKADSKMVKTPYVGNTKCVSCHPEIAASWKKTRHANAFATLQKKCKEYCPDCLPCHSTGSYAHDKKGFSSPSTTPHLFNVQCEECHGAAEKHVKNPDHPYGNTINAGVCILCHTTNTDQDFSFPEDRKLIAH